MKDGREEGLREIQMLEESMQSFGAQKQMFAAQALEIDAALTELKVAKESYRIVGNIMVRKDPKRIGEELSQKKETVEVRIRSIEKQEEKTLEKIRKIQKEILKE